MHGVFYYVINVNVVGKFSTVYYRVIIREKSSTSPLFAFQPQMLSFALKNTNFTIVCLPIGVALNVKNRCFAPNYTFM